MQSPAELVIGAWRRGPDYLMRYRSTIEELTGLTLSKNPEKAWRQFKEKMRSVKRDFKEQCVNFNGYQYCLYQYKELSAKNYLHTPFLSAMRGTVIKWYDNGESVTVAFPFAKFFNYQEVDETRNLPGAGFIATEKLDGTLIIVWRDPDTGELHFNTRGMLEWFGVKPGKVRLYRYKGEGIENPYVKAFINAVKRLGLWDTLEAMAKEDRTVMFELVGKVPASRVANKFEVIDPNDKWTPYLLAVRLHDTFNIIYANHGLEPGGFPTPATVRADTLAKLVDTVREWRDREGVVLYYPDRTYRDGMSWWNYMVKVKSYKYALEGLIYLPNGTPNWRSIARLVITGAHDDIVALAPGDVAHFATEVMKRYEAIRETWLDLVEASTNWSEREWNILANNMNARWLIPYLKEARKRGDAPLKRLIIEKMPRTKDGILGFIERLENRLASILKSL